MNRLEQLEFLDDIEGWFRLRDIRNQLAHDYEDDVEELVSIINVIFNSKAVLQGYYHTIMNKLNGSMPS